MIELPLKEPQGTDTYCWRTEEVRAMLELRRGRPVPACLAGVLLALATTGLRLSELSGPRWSDIDLDGGMIRPVDETSSGRCRVFEKGHSAR